MSSTYSNDNRYLDLTVMEIKLKMNGKKGWAFSDGNGTVLIRSGDQKSRRISISISHKLSSKILSPDLLESATFLLVPDSCSGEAL